MVLDTFRGWPVDTRMLMLELLGKNPEGRPQRRFMGVFRRGEGGVNKEDGEDALTG